MSTKKKWRMKKIITFALSFILTLSFAACDNDKDNKSKSTNIPTSHDGNANNNDTIQFGGYDWIVLDEQDGKTLIITEKIIERRSYHSVDTDITWEDCDLRNYLNGEFYNTFTDDEKSKITETEVVNNGREENNTHDKIFLLSIDEAKNYFEDNDSRVAYPMDGIKEWWLRSPGGLSVRTAYVREDGTVCVDGDRVNYYDGGVRPALWLNL